MTIKWQKGELEHMRNTGIVNNCNADAVKLAVHLEVWERGSSEK